MATKINALDLIVPRGGPVQTGVPGLYTCVQSICGSSYSCSVTGVQLQCVNAMMQGYDMEYQGTFMECDGDKGSYPYNSCTCTIDYLDCDSTASPTPSPIPNFAAGPRSSRGSGAWGMLTILLLPTLAALRFLA